MLSQSLSHSVSHCSCWDLTNVTLATWPVKIRQPLGGRFPWCYSEPIRFKTSGKFQDSMAWVRCTFVNLLIKLGPHFFSRKSQPKKQQPFHLRKRIWYIFLTTILPHFFKWYYLSATQTLSISDSYMWSHPHQLQDIQTFWFLSVFVFPRTFFSTSNLFSPSQLLYLDVGLYIRISYISFCMIRHMLVRNYEGNYKNKVVKF